MVRKHTHTELHGTQLANEHVYAVLSARGHLYADLPQDDADVLLALHVINQHRPAERGFASTINPTLIPRSPSRPIRWQQHGGLV
jgi:hypothetical protein